MIRLRGNARPGYTLVELVTSIAITTVLLGGTASAVLLASRALPDGDDLLDVRLRSESVVNQMAVDLLCAESFPTRSVTGVEFTVADRNHGAVGAETINYSWSGTPGDALTRRYNGGTVVDVLTGVREFELAYDVRTVSETTVQTTEITSDEIVLAFFNGWAGVTGTDREQSVWTSEYIVADIPDGVDELRFTRVFLKIRQEPAGAGSRSVAIHPVATPGSPEPAADPIGTPFSMLNLMLPLVTSEWVWVEFPFSDAVIDSPTSKEYCIVTKGTAALSGHVLFLYSRSAPADATVGLWSDDNGASWDPRANERDRYDKPFYVYGTYTTRSEEPIETNRYFVTGVTIKLRAGPDAAATVETGVQILNAPEVATP